MGNVLTPGSPGCLPTLSMTTNRLLVILGEGCYASHQPSDASTPTVIVTVCYKLQYLMSWFAHYPK